MEHDKINILLLKNKQGFFPSPYEPEVLFWKRSQTAYKEESCSLSAWKNALRIVQNQFDIHPNWIPLEISDRSLKFWEAAALWQENEKVWIQIPASKRFIPKWVDLEEIFAHEMVHAVRGGFCEPRFEEILAYSTSKHRWRQILGGIFRTPGEASCFVSLFMIAALFSSFATVAPYLWAFSSLYLLYLLTRVIRDLSTFKRCEKNLKSLLKDKSHSLAVMIRLTDAEIVLFAKGVKEEIEAYFTQNKESLRLQMIRNSYPFR